MEEERVSSSREEGIHAETMTYTRTTEFSYSLMLKLQLHHENYPL